MMMVVVMALLFSVSVVLSDMIRYDNHVVLRLSLDSSNTQQVDMYRHLRDNDFKYNCSFWSDSDIRVGPNNVQSIQNMLKDAGITFNLMIEDVQALIDLEREHLTTAKQATFGGVPDPDFFKAYHNYDDHNKFMDDVVATYPSLAKSVTIGNTYENRTIYGVTVTGSSSSAADKPGIYYECGIHAREWIAHSTCAYMMYQLVSQYGKDSRITNLVDKVEWTFVPVLNVDGYVFTWTKDRMWRKTRKPNKGSNCIGTDPNRNWDSHWCEQGASKDPCSESYCGSAAFTENCVRESAKYVEEHKNIVSFIDFHSYGQMWMRPYGYTKSEPKDYKSQDEMGKAAVATIKQTHGMSYKEGSIYSVVYPASGSSADYIYDSLGRKWPFGVELRDTGRHGFVLPANQIVPTGEEIFAAALGMGEYVLAH